MPVPLAKKSIPILVSPPDAVQVGLVPVAAFAKVSSFTALVTVSKIINSLPLASAINPRSANLGAVSVLLVNVSVLAINDTVPVAFGNVNVLSVDATLAKSRKPVTAVPVNL